MLELEIRTSSAEFTLDVHEQIDTSATTSIYGPSGSGKTTLLRHIAGFESAAGHVSFANEVWSDSRSKIWVPPHKRAVSTVFQDTRLFTHMNVAANLDYASKRADINDRHGYSQNDVVKAFDLDPLLDRDSRQLSGGEAKRVAIARALLSHPKLLLLDEPLAGLDRHRRASILPYLERLNNEFNLATIYVSHSVSEVARLADHIIVLSNGSVERRGPTSEILSDSHIDPITSTLDSGVALQSVVLSHDLDYQLTRVSCSSESITLPYVSAVAPGEHLSLFIRARDVALATERPAGTSIRNILAARVIEVVQSDDSPHADVELAIGSTTESTRPLRARVTRAAVDELELRNGQEIFALIKSVSFDSDF